jgi:dihydrofolate reductase
MSKLITGAFVSLDGVIEAPWEWIGGYFDAEGKEHASAKLDESDIFLLGRKTFQKFASTWPQIKGDAYLDRVNAIEKRVVSKTLTEVGWNAQLIKSDAAKAIAALKKERGKNILKYGIGALDYALMQQDLVDEFELWMIPVKVGRGKRLFEDINLTGFELHLKGSKTFRNGVVLLTYIPQRIVDKGSK